MTPIVTRELFLFTKKASSDSWARRMGRMWFEWVASTMSVMTNSGEAYFWDLRQGWVEEPCSGP